MISFKGAHFPKDVILYVFSSMSGMVFLTVTLKPLWKKEAVKLTIPLSTDPMMGFKAFRSAQATIDGIETAHMIRKGPLDENIPAYKQFMALAG